MEEINNNSMSQPFIKSKYGMDHNPHNNRQL